MRKVLTCSLMALALLAAACGSQRAPSALNSDSNNSGAPSTPSTAVTPSTSATNDTSAPNNSTTAPTSTPAADPFGWHQFGSDKNVEQGSLQVPIDYNDPSKGKFTLHIVRHKASNPKLRIGSLLVNPGGPGFGGSILAEQATAIYGQDLLDRFDIVAWDPRGTGKSTPAIDCITDYDHFFNSSDITPDTPAAKQQIVDLAKQFTDACISKNSKILDFVGTNNSARDMDSIRQALGEAKISYFGFSYGSELGATWATLFPSTVRAAVLDGAADPGADEVESGLQQSKGFEKSLDTFLQQCSTDSKCPFNNEGNAAAAFDTLMQGIDDSPIPTEEGRPPLTRGAALTGVAEAMYSDASWPQLADALASAQSGNGAGLLALYDEYYQRQPDGSYDNSLEAFNVISCMDSPDRLTVAEDDANAPKFNAVAPRLSPGTTGSYQCDFFPPSPDPRVKITGKGAGPILVMGTTGDPATPLDSTRNMAKALEQGVLVVVTADQHTGYGVNRCSLNTVDDYLVDPAKNVPPNNKQCK